MTKTIQTMKTSTETTVTKSVWTGSIVTLSIVAAEIESRWGADAVKMYDPEKNCFTFNRWKDEGYKVKKGEKAIKSSTWIKSEKVNKAGVTETSMYPRTVCLFFINQVEKISSVS